MAGRRVQLPKGRHRRPTTNTTATPHEGPREEPSTREESAESQVGIVVACVNNLFILNKVTRPEPSQQRQSGHREIRASSGCEQTDNALTLMRAMLTSRDERVTSPAHQASERG